METHVALAMVQDVVVPPSLPPSLLVPLSLPAPLSLLGGTPLSVGGGGGELLSTPPSEEGPASAEDVPVGFVESLEQPHSRVSVVNVATARAHRAGFPMRFMA